MICLSDDSGLEITSLNGEPGIYSARWGGIKNDFNKAIKRVFYKMNKIEKDWKDKNSAKFVCCLTLFWPNGKSFTSKGIIKGKISAKKKGKKGFGYDPIFIPNGYSKTFGEMESKLKMKIDHRSKAFRKIKFFFLLIHVKKFFFRNFINFQAMFTNIFIYNKLSMKSLKTIFVI